jgi:hypothetical protein
LLFVELDPNPIRVLLHDPLQSNVRRSWNSVVTAPSAASIVSTLDASANAPGTLRAVTKVTGDLA